MNGIDGSSKESLGKGEQVCPDGISGGQTWPKRGKGYIGLPAEGAPLELHNLRIRKNDE
jgi:hypothetical protein